MTSPYQQRHRFPESSLWQRFQRADYPVQFMIELTPRCGLNCRHCYVNRPAGDAAARARELSCAEILDIARQAAELGAIWCTLTGGDPLLREDFQEIYLGLKRLGLLVTVYTNGTVITPALADFFRRYPPRDLYLTVYGATEETYERVTRRPGAYAAFRRGVEALHAAGVAVRFKAIALRSNLHELAAIADFCHTYTAGMPVHFGTVLHLRTDGDAARNAEILTERLTPEEVLDCRRFNDATPAPPAPEAVAVAPAIDPDYLFQCRAGLQSYVVGYDGQYRLCISLVAPETMYDLRAGTLREALYDFTPRVRALRRATDTPCTPCTACTACTACTVRRFCISCPAYAHLETGRMDAAPPYFCTLAQACAQEHAVGAE